MVPTPDRRTAILDAFDALVERYGVEKISVHEVAEEVGISVGTLYNEFGSKDGLVASAAERLREGVLARTDGTASGPSAEAELRALVLGWLRALMDMSFPKRFLVFRSVAPRTRRGGIGTRFVAGRDVFRARLADRIARVLERGVADGSFEVPNIASTAARLVDAFTEYWPPPAALDREPADVLANANELLDLLLRGLRPR
jgi:AcrR family transcriptional regulator